MTWLQQGIPEAVRGSGDLLRAPTHRRHGRAGDQVLRRFCLGDQELRRRRTVRHLSAGLRLPRHDDLGAHHAGRPDGRERGRARHRHAPLPRIPEGP